MHTDLSPSGWEGIIKHVPRVVVEVSAVSGSTSIPSFLTSVEVALFGRVANGGGWEASEGGRFSRAFFPCTFGSWTDVCCLCLGSAASA